VGKAAANEVRSGPGGPPLPARPSAQRPVQLGWTSRAEAALGVHGSAGTCRRRPWPPRSLTRPRWNSRHVNACAAAAVSSRG